MAKIQNQAYKQAPWRLQAQRFGVIALVLVGVATISFVYLTISAQIATVGIQVQNLEAERQDIERENADLLAKWGLMTSAAVMEEKAKAMGYELIDPMNVEYMVLEGYTGRELPIIETAPYTNLDLPNLIKPSYTESLWEWFNNSMLVAVPDRSGDPQ